jgi:hypothetical protein
VKLDEFATMIDSTAGAVARMKRLGQIKPERFKKSGRSMYVHKKDALADLATVPVPARGKLPVWGAKFGSKDMKAALKARAKAEAKAAA